MRTTHLHIHTSYIPIWNSVAIQIAFLCYILSNFVIAHCFLHSPYMSIFGFYRFFKYSDVLFDTIKYRWKYPHIATKCCWLYVWEEKTHINFGQRNKCHKITWILIFLRLFIELIHLKWIITLFYLFTCFFFCWDFFFDDKERSLLIWCEQNKM